MGIAAFTIITARELDRYGVTVNAIAPNATTRLTENVLKQERQQVLRPSWIAPIAVWLASERSSGVSGRVFEASGELLSLAEGWHRGPTASQDDRWDPAKLGAVIPDLVTQAKPNATMRD